jgi:hypothetical protein
MGREAAPAVPALVSELHALDGKKNPYLALRSNLSPMSQEAAHAFRGIAEVVTVNSAFRALGMLGDVSTPAIPELMRISSVNEEGFPANFNTRDAIAALGKLGKYDPEVVVHHLVQLLDRPTHEVEAAEALRTIGPAARPALPALRMHLSAAIADRRVEAADALRAALATLDEENARPNRGTH